MNLGYKSVLYRFSKDATFAESLLNEGDNEYDCERYDLLKLARLPKSDKLEHMRLVYLDIANEQDAPTIPVPWTALVLHVQNSHLSIGRIH